MIRLILQLNPDSVKVHKSLGVAMARTGNFKGAVVHLREALRIKPDDIQTENLLNEILKLQQQNSLK